MSDTATRPGREQASINKQRELALIPMGIALNTAVGMLVHWLKLPLYLDAIGTIIVTILVGLRAGIICGVLSCGAGYLLGNAALIWFSGTQAIIAVYAFFIARNGWFRTLPHTLISGLGMGIVAGAVSAPVAAMVFGGVTGSGASLIIGYLVKTGQGILRAAFMTGVTTDSVDKILQCLLAVWLLKGLPQSLLRRFRNPLLERNSFVAPKEN